MAKNRYTLCKYTHGELHVTISTVYPLYIMYIPGKRSRFESSIHPPKT